MLKDHTRPGVKTSTLNNLADDMIKELGGMSMTKGYLPAYSRRRFPGEISIQVNSQIGFGVPGLYKLKDGDIVSYSLSVKKDGVCADGSLSVGVGEISDRDRLLLSQARKALYAGIKKVKAGVTLREIGEAIESKANSKGFVVSHTFTGHGIGVDPIMEPPIYHCKNWLYNWPGEYKKMEEIMNTKLVEGQRICLEPALTEKDPFGRLMDNHLTFCTRDGQKSAVFEHTLEVTATGCNILTTHIC